MDDDAFLARFEACEIPLEEWNHQAHLRVAWTYLSRHGLDEATRRMREGIRRFNASKGLEDALDRGYHETLTVAFVRILDTLRRVHGPGADAAAFLEKHTEVASKTLLRLFYSRDRIMSREAKRAFVEPDLTPLPAPPGASTSPGGA
jgi:hypothetical protein